MQFLMLSLACGTFFALGNTNTAWAAPAQITAPAETIVASQLDNSWDKNASSIKEGDITISYDTSIGKGALIQKTLNDLNNRYSTYIRML